MLQYFSIVAAERPPHTRGLEKGATPGFNTAYLRSATIHRKNCEKLDKWKTSEIRTAPIIITGLDFVESHEVKRYFGDCLDLGIHYEAGWGVSRDEKKAGSLYQRACNAGLGEAVACKQAIIYYNQDCEQGQVAACTALGRIYNRNDILPQDRERAKGFFEQACAGKKGAACYELGSFYKYGKMGEKKLQEAQTFFEKACSYGYSPGCSKESQ